MRFLRMFALAVLPASAMVLAAQTPPRSAPPQGVAVQTAGPRLRGRVTDLSGAVIPGSSVKVSQNGKAVSEAVTNDTGDFDVQLPAGEYQIEVNAPDFKTFKQTVRVAANAAPLTIPMSLATLATVVDVNESSNENVSIDSATLNANTISGTQLQDLPDNEDDLAQYLQDLAAASGVAGAQATFVIDGFNGGRLPPKDQILQIIIDNNAFTAEGNGGTRIQIITRPGTGNWTGQFGGNFSDSSLNASNPTATNKPARRQKTFNLTSGGPIIPRILAATFTGQNSETEAEGNTIRAVLAPGMAVDNNASVISPSTRRNMGARGQMYLTKIHTLNFNATYGTNKSLNQGIGGFNLPSRASNTSGHNWQIQLSDRAIPSPKLVNELRFLVSENDSSTTPTTNAIAINVQGAFNDGGGQNRNVTKDRQYELGNTIRWTVNPKWTLQIGTEGSYEKKHSVSENNFLGTYTFAGLDDFIAGRPQTFTKTSGNPLLDSAQGEFTTFLQADWRVAKKVNIGLGGRYIAQTNLKDFNNAAPTASVGIQVTPKTILRAGARLSYQGFGLNNVETLLRNDGTTRQSTLNILYPRYIPGQIPPEAATALASGSNSSSIYVRASDLQAPYTMNAQISLDRTFGLWRFTNAFDFTRGEHLIRTRNINAPFPGTPLTPDLLARLNSLDAATKAAARAEVDLMRPYYPVIGNLYQFESAGASFSKTWTFTVNTPMGGVCQTDRCPYMHIWKVGFGGRQSLTIGSAKDNGGNAPNQYDWTPEWARSQNDQKVRFQGNLNFRFPKATNIAMNVNLASGRPYTITSGRDLNGDQSTSDRPAGVNRNTGTAPSTYNVNMTFTKIFYLKNPAVSQRANSFAPQQRAPAAVPAAAPAAAPGGQALGGQQPVAPGGQSLGGGQNDQGNRQTANPTGPQLTFTTQVTNLLNSTQVRGISGVQTSTLFGKPTNFAGGRSMVIGLNVRF